MVTIKKATIVLIVLLSIFFFRGVLLNAYYTITSDEPVNFTGLALWKTQTFAHSPTHPPGIKLLMALFLAHLDPEVPIPEGYPNNDEFLYGRLLIFQFNQHMFESMIMWGRIPTLLLGLLAAIYLYRWASEITNKKSALFAVLLYTFFPLIVALSSIATNDIIVMTFFIMTLYYFKHYVQSGLTRHAVFTGVCLGIALLAKHTGILLVPLLFIAAVALLFTAAPVPQLRRFRKSDEEPATLKRKIGAILAFFIFIGLVSGFVLNAGYLFEGTMTPLREFDFKHNFFPVFNNPSIGWVPVPLPFWYFKGLETNQIFGEIEHYFKGEWLTNEDWYFFIFSFLVKTPIPILIMLLIALALLPKLAKGRPVDTILIVLTVVGITAFFSLKQYKLGLRHLLPIFPMLFLLLAMLWQHAHIEGKHLKRVLYVLLAWYLVSTMFIYPHYLSYFNEFIGGSKNGYKYFLDSNVDWGQDLNGVKEWMDARGVSEIGLSYWGNDVPQLRGINGRLIPCEYTPGLHVISANNLYGLIHTGQPKDCYKWLRTIDPIDRIGNSIFVFDIKE